MRARTAGPATAPVDPSTPEGMSTATTGTTASPSARIASACVPSGTPWNPVPKTASIATSARPSSRAAREPDHGRTRTTVPRRRARFVAVGSREEIRKLALPLAEALPHSADAPADQEPPPA